MALSPLELADLHARVLYIHNSGGRLTGINEADPEDATPRFFMVRTPAGNIWRTRFDLPSGVAVELERLAAAEPVCHDLAVLREAPLYLARYTELLEQYEPVVGSYAGPAYYLPDLPTSTDPNIVIIKPENAALLRANFPYTYDMQVERAPVVVWVEDGAAVAACYSARSTTQAAEAGVHTLEAYRGRGIAVGIVRAWAAEIFASGRLPLYSTWWENTASQAVAAKLGAVLYGADFSLT